MSAVTVSLCSTLMFVLFVCAEPSIIIAKPGQDITLTCRAPNNNSSKIIVVEWIRDDLGDKNVLLYRDRKFAPATQHPYFKNQVDLQDRQMKDGDVSLILKNVTIKDTGTYECHVFMEGAQSWQILSSINLHVLPPDPKIIAAESGKNVILTCRTPNNNIRVVEWSRADLGEKYVLFYQDGHFVPHNQHRSFVNRVDLQDRQMEDGDVSLILKDVTINDTGTYECRVRKGNNRRKRANLSGDPISSIDLHVVPPGHTGGDVEDGSAGLIVVLSVFAVLLVVAVFGFLIHKKPVFRFNECNLLFNPV